MKLTLQLESAKHPRQQTPAAIPAPQDTDSAWRLVEDAWRKVNEPGIDPEEQRRRRNWLGGALAVFAAVTGEDARVLEARLGPSVPRETSAEQYGVTMFREGRSAPPPPRHPGAQRAVE